jgi:hypothetical protein
MSNTPDDTYPRFAIPDLQFATIRSPGVIVHRGVNAFCQGRMHSGRFCRSPLPAGMHCCSGVLSLAATPAGSSQHNRQSRLIPSKFSEASQSP